MLLPTLMGMIRIRINCSEGWVLAYNVCDAGLDKRSGETEGGGGGAQKTFQQFKKN